MIPNNNRLIYLEFKKQPQYWKWFVMIFMVLFWVPISIGATINFMDLEPGMREDNKYHVWVYFKDTGLLNNGLS